MSSRDEMAHRSHQLQHVGPQHDLLSGFRARMNALANLPSSCGAMRSTSNPASARNARASSIWYTRQGSTSTATNPAAFNWDAYSRAPSAPATQPTHSSMLLRTSAGIAPRTTTSETANRPFGFNTRKASRSTASLSTDKLITQVELLTSMD